MLSGMLLGGCPQTLGTVATSEDMQKIQCNAWRPFEYNSKNPKRDFHAGKKLARELAIHNKTGTNLKCWN